MSDLVTAIVAEPYLLVPIFVWLWGLAKLPKVQWDKIGAGALMAFSGKVLEALANQFVPFASLGWGSGLAAFFNFFAVIAYILGLAMIGFYALADAFMMWKA